MYVGETWRAWLSELSEHDRATAIAHYRVQLLIKAHIEDAIATKPRKRAKRGGSDDE